MHTLLSTENSFDCVISFGVYYYSDAAGMRKAVSEFHRVRHRNAPALVAQAMSDFRRGKGTRVEEYTFRLENSETKEYGSVQHFLAESDVSPMFAGFSNFKIEQVDSTFNSRGAVNSE